MNKKYPHGYLPKISYWMNQWEDAAKEVNEERMKYCESKLFYFMSNQVTAMKVDRDVYSK